jgi:hypothetical protein
MYGLFIVVKGKKENNGALDIMHLLLTNNK